MPVSTLNWQDLLPHDARSVEIIVNCCTRAGTRCATNRHQSEAIALVHYACMSSEHASTTVGWSTSSTADEFCSQHCRLDMLCPFDSDIENMWVHFKKELQDRISQYVPEQNKKLGYRRVTARCVVSVEILPITTQHCKNYLYHKSWTNPKLWS